MIYHSDVFSRIALAAKLRAMAISLCGMWAWSPEPASNSKRTRVGAAWWSRFARDPAATASWDTGPLACRVLVPSQCTGFRYKSSRVVWFLCFKSHFSPVMFRNIFFFQVVWDRAVNDTFSSTCSSMMHICATMHAMPWSDLTVNKY
jgi:hypothetical protein